MLQIDKRKQQKKPQSIDQAFGVDTMSIFSACVNQFDDPAEFVQSHLGEEEEPWRQSRQHQQGTRNKDHHNNHRRLGSNPTRIVGGIAGGGSSNGDRDSVFDDEIHSETPSTDRYQTEFTDKVLSHALKLKKKCKALKQALLESEQRSKDERNGRCHLYTLYHTIPHYNTTIPHYTHYTVSDRCSNTRTSATPLSPNSDSNSPST